MCIMRKIVFIRTHTTFMAIGMQLFCACSFLTEIESYTASVNTVES